MDAMQEFHMMYPCERPFFIASDEYWKGCIISLSRAPNARATVEASLRETFPMLPSNPISLIESMGGDFVMSCHIMMFTISLQDEIVGYDAGKHYVNWPGLRSSSFERPAVLFPFPGPAWELCTWYHKEWRNRISDKIRKVMVSDNWTPQSAHAALKLGIDLQYMYLFHGAMFSIFNALAEDQLGVEDDGDDYEEEDDNGS